MVQKLLSQLDALAFQLQYWYMKRKITNERIGRHYAFFHPRPTSQVILKKYRQLTKIVLATGCFDVLHQEHKSFLRAAKKLGGILMVGAETDQRVRQLKGPGRPLNSIKQRIKNLEILKIADIVFPLPSQFNQLKHFRALIEQIQPAVLAVSSSTPHLAVKRRILQQFGGRVIVVLKHNPKISTSILTKRKLKFPVRHYAKKELQQFIDFDKKESKNLS